MRRHWGKGLGTISSCKPLLFLGKMCLPQAEAGSAQTSKGLRGWRFEGSLAE